MASVSGAQYKRAQASRVGSSIATRSTANTTASQATRANSIAAMPSSAQFSRNVGGTSCNCGAAGRGKKLSTEVWDPFQFDRVAPGSRASTKDLLQQQVNNNNERRGQSHDDGCRRPLASKNYCDSGESDSAVSDKGRRTAEFLYDMWCQQKLCDVVLRCCGDGKADDTILAHKVH